MSSVFSVPRLWYPTKSLSTRILFMSLLSDAPSFAVTCVLEEVDRPSSLRSPFYPLLVLVKYNGVRIERE
jgi:hypothetical protein